MALADIYQLIDRQLWASGEEILNVYYYSEEAAGGNAADLINAYQELILPAVVACQSDQVSHVELTAISLGDLTDFATETVSSTGAAVQDALPRFAAVNMTLRANSRAVRPGSKRYSGITEDQQVDGVITVAGYLALWETLRALLDDIITASGGSGFYTPVVVKRVPYVTSSGNDAYRLPITDIELEYAIVSSVLFNANISHQVSRGNGR